MPSEPFYHPIIEKIESGAKTSEVATLLLNLCFENSVSDDIMDEALDIASLPGQDEPVGKSLKKRMVALLEEMPLRKDKIYHNLDAEIVKLSKENHFNEIENAAFTCSGIYKKLGLFTLEDINIELRLGEITAIVGENGNGKTTLCRIVAGLLLQDKGKVAYPYLGEGTPNKINWGRVKGKIAYLSQETLPFSGKVKKTLQLVASLNGIKGNDNIRQVDFIIRSLGLIKYEDKEWSELSSGYKLRFSLARILIVPPQLLILDEPLAFLDPVAQIAFLSDLREYADSINYPMSILISSQHIHEIEYIADKIIFIKDGKITYYNSVHKIGEGNQSNNYELSCKAGLDEVKEALRRFNSINLSFNGLYYDLEMPLSVTPGDILMELRDSGIEINYFRNISNSSKKFLLNNA